MRKKKVTLSVLVACMIIFGVFAAVFTYRVAHPAEEVHLHGFMTDGSDVLNLGVIQCTNGDTVFVPLREVETKDGPSSDASVDPTSRSYDILIEDNELTYVKESGADYLPAVRAIDDEIYLTGTEWVFIPQEVRDQW